MRPMPRMVLPIVCPSNDPLIPCRPSICVALPIQLNGLRVHVVGLDMCYMAWIYRVAVVALLMGVGGSYRWSE